jgi:flavin reductase (DIM6/NTAB) family NADH-FMN oxidoreductase RutF
MNQSHLPVDPAELSLAERHRLTIGSILPRPIAWTTSLSPRGVLNLAPFSYFMGVHSYTPALAISVGSRDGQPKDTWANVAASGEFVVNVVNEEVAERMNLTSAAYPADIDELEMAGLTAVPSLVVKPPRVGEAPISMECRLLHVLPIGEPPLQSGLIVGQIVMWHIRPDLLRDGKKIDGVALRAIGRMGGSTYTRTRDQFDMVIPDWRATLPRGPDARRG